MAEEKASARSGATQRRDGAPAPGADEWGATNVNERDLCHRADEYKSPAVGAPPRTLVPGR